MLRDALEYLIGLGKTEIIDVNGQDYSTNLLHHIKDPAPKALEVKSLKGLVDYIKSEFDSEFAEGLMRIIHIQDEEKVSLLSCLRHDGIREEYVRALAPTSNFIFGRFHDHESFIISLQANFVQTETVKQILKIVGNIKDEGIRAYGDDGVTQKVTAKTGIASVDEVALPNPVSLVPYRTFIEIEQPESQFVFRMRQGRDGPECALFEADGGAWKIEAMDRIKSYLQDELAGIDIQIMR